MKKKIIAFTILTLCLFGFAFTVQAADGYYQEISSFGDNDYVKLDFDGDGKNEVLEVFTDNYTADNSGVLKTYIEILIDGKVVFSNNANGYSVLNGYYIEMGNGERLFMLSVIGENDYTHLSGLYTLNSAHKLQRIANIRSIERGAWTHIGLSPWKITVGNSSLKILCSTQLGGIGRVNYTIPYTIKGGKATLSSKNFLLNHRYSSNRNNWTVSRSFTGYTKAYRGRKVFTVQIGQKAKISYIYFGATYAYAKVQIAQNGKLKTGWVKLPNSDKTYFREAYYAA